MGHAGDDGYTYVYIYICVYTQNSIYVRTCKYVHGCTIRGYSRILEGNHSESYIRELITSIT